MEVSVVPRLLERKDKGCTGKSYLPMPQNRKHQAHLRGWGVRAGEKPPSPNPVGSLNVLDPPHPKTQREVGLGPKAGLCGVS